MRPSAILTLAALSNSCTAIVLPAEQDVVVTRVELSPERLVEIERSWQLESGNSTDLVKREDRCFWQAWGGNNCDGSAGKGLVNFNQCVNTQGRHSYFISPNCGNTEIGTTFADDSSCNQYSLRYTNTWGCYNVNTGRGWSSSYITKS